ncbi:MAG: hypothetical protein ACREF4_06435 [Gammaproteobacteria bacterium]
MRGALARLAAQSWRHPSTRAPVSFAVPTIERWYYAARQTPRDPVGVLRHRRRRDAGQPRALSARLQRLVQDQYQRHRSWSYQLHLDNLVVLIAEDPTLGSAPSYSTLRRYMRAQGLRPVPRVPMPETPGALAAVHRREHLEVRSFEAEYVHGLWHLDFHHGSRRSSVALVRGSAPSCWACWTITRAWPAISSGISTRPPRRWSTG